MANTGKIRRPDFIIGDEIILERIPVKSGFTRHKVGNIVFILWGLLFVRPYGSRRIVLRFASAKLNA